MCITAKVLRPGVPLAAGAPVTRVVVLVGFTAPIFRPAQRVSARKQR